MTASHWVCSSNIQDQIGLTLPTLAAAGTARTGLGEELGQGCVIYCVFA